MANGICKKVTKITEFCKISLVPGNGAKNKTRPKTSTKMTKARMKTQIDDRIWINRATATVVPNLI
jgi:hypothetical protein